MHIEGKELLLEDLLFINEQLDAHALTKEQADEAIRRVVLEYTSREDNDD